MNQVDLSSPGRQERHGRCTYATEPIKLTRLEYEYCQRRYVPRRGPSKAHGYLAPEEVQMLLEVQERLREFTQNAVGNTAFSSLRQE